MRKALGRGLDALLPGSVRPPPVAPPAPERGAAVESPPAVALVPVATVVPSRDQPRRHFAEEALEALAESIRRHGLLQPLVVHASGETFTLIAGERRLRAAQRAGLAEVPVLIRDAPPRERYELALIENLQREDLTPLEEAEAYRHLMDVYGLTQDEVAREVGKSRPAIANALRLLGLPDAVKADLETGTLTAGHARAVLQIEGVTERVEFAREIATRRLSKRAAEDLAASRRARGAAKRPRPAVDLNLRALSDELTRALGTRVRIEPRRGRGGAIVIEYYSDAEFDGLLQRLRVAGRA